jgi:tRNA nucleotidyltransferase/poly(A) polymerase
MVHMPAELAQAARAVAETLATAGTRAWLVGGAVRDLALGLAPADADLASAARPEELERLFPRTYAVGKAFGTVVVRVGALDVQVTTFRSESDYDDARRPRAVRFAQSLEEDAARRDFTCNALYLDPLTDELVDPTGGFTDLVARRLRCVGDPVARFGEDGLRLLRLARLAAHHGLEVESATFAGARTALEALRGVSPERVLTELERMAEGTAPARAAALLEELGVLARLPGFAELAGPGRAARVDALARLEGAGPARFFALLFFPGPERSAEAALTALLALRPPRALHQRVARIYGLLGELEACLQELASVPRSRWIRLVRSEEFADALAVAAAWQPERHAEARRALVARAAALAPSERWPPARITSAELARSGIPRGPRWGALLRAAEDAQLDGEITDAPSARAWLARHGV